MFSIDLHSEEHWDALRKVARSEETKTLLLRAEISFYTLQNVALAKEIEAISKKEHGSLRLKAIRAEHHCNDIRLKFLKTLCK